MPEAENKREVNVPELSYAGKPLIFPSMISKKNQESIKEFMHKWQPTYNYVAHTKCPAYISENDNVVQDEFYRDINLATWNYPKPPEVRLNTLYWPQGATRWACGYFVADQRTADELKEEVTPSDDTTSKKLFRWNLPDGTKNGMVLETELWMLPPIPIPSTGDDGCSLIVLVDDRYLWQWQDIGPNVKDVTSWATLFDDVDTYLGITLERDEIDSAHLKPDPNMMRLAHRNAAMIADMAAANLNMRIIRDLDGTVKLRNYANGLTDYGVNYDADPTWALVAGEFYEKSPIPESVQVCFPKIANGTPNCGNEYYAYTKDYSEYTDSSEGIFAVPPSVYSGTLITFRSSAWADFSGGGGAPDNDSTLDALADKIAKEYFRSTTRSFDFTFVGIKEWTGTPFDDHLLYDIGTEHKGQLYATTRVQSLPHNCFPQSYQHYDENVELNNQGRDLLRFEVKTGFKVEPGSNGTCHPVRWDDGAMDWQADTSQEIEVYDPFYKVYLLAGEQSWCTYNCDSERYETVGEVGLLRLGKADSGISAGSSGTVSVWTNGSGAADTTENVTAYYNWGEKSAISSGDEVWLRYQWDAQRWHIHPVIDVSLYVTSPAVQDVYNKCPTGAYTSGVANGYTGGTASTPTDTIEFNNDAGFIVDSLTADTKTKLVTMNSPWSYNADTKYYARVAEENDHFPKWRTCAQVEHDLIAGRESLNDEDCRHVITYAKLGTETHFVAHSTGPDHPHDEDNSGMYIYWGAANGTWTTASPAVNSKTPGYGTSSHFYITASKQDPLSTLTVNVSTTLRGLDGDYTVTGGDVMTFDKGIFIACDNTSGLSRATTATAGGPYTNTCVTADFCP